MDSCQRFKEMVSDYIDGELDHQNQSLMEQHLRDCLGCKKNISQLKNLIQNLRDLPKIMVSPDFETILRARISMESSLARRRRERWFPLGQFRVPVYALAAVVLLVAIFTVAILNKSNHYAAPQAKLNSEWYQGEGGVEKFDPTTNERYIYIIEKQPVPNINSQPGSNVYEPIDQKTYIDSIQTFKDSELQYNTTLVSEPKIY
jgi:hypothetical protein